MVKRNWFTYENLNFSLFVWRIWSIWFQPLNILLATNKSSSANSNHHQSNGRNVAANSLATGSTPASITTTSNEQSQQCIVWEQDQYMPIANVIRIMRRILPSHAKISDDAKETIQECVSQYISFITGEANERYQREQRKTVTYKNNYWHKTCVKIIIFVELNWFMCKINY